LKPAFDHLVSDADRALRSTPHSVMEKRLVPPSGDKHDYMSIAPYFWPDPAKPDGLPYIRKDGQVNPQRGNADTDAKALGQMSGNVQTLALAFYFTGNEQYATHAAKLLRVWFIDAGTRMNPNLNFAQAIPGRSAGRGIGIIDTVSLIYLVDSIGLLGQSKAWTADDQKAMVAWFDAYLDWMLTSKNGKDEAAATNNHGVWYDAQVTAYALLARKTDLARQMVESAKSKRIVAQIRDDGSMPRELARTNSLSYSLYNLTAFFNLANLGKHVGVDLWNYPPKQAPRLRKALDYLAPYVDPDKHWPHEQISQAKRKSNELPALLRRASIAYGEPDYDDLRRKFASDHLNDSRMLLLYPH
jgi:hypothetical protein